MATKKVTQTTEQAYKSALLALVGLDFEVRLDDTQVYARVRHPRAASYIAAGTHVDLTKVHYRAYQDRVEVDGKRVAKTEILDRTVAQALRDLENAQREVDQAREREARRETQYAALMEAGVDQAAKGMPYAKQYTAQAHRLRSEGEGLVVDLEPGSKDGTIVLTITAANGSLPVVAAALKAARKVAKV